MSRKKIDPKELYEDEKAIPAEENNCFGFDKKCEVLAANKMSTKDKINCGTMRCPFYKPREHVNSIKHVTKEGVSFETYEEFHSKTGTSMITMDNLKDYETYPHADSDVTSTNFFEYVRKERCFDKLTLTDLKDYAKYMNIVVDDLNKKEIIDVVNQIL